ncbi:MAG: DUF695 domain-containing protein [Ramlibacter sp.]
MKAEESTTDAASIAAFWLEFSSSEAALKSLPLRERMERGNELLERYLKDLALEFSGSDDDPVVELIVTAHGRIDRFQVLNDLVAAAPSLKHHAVRAFRERTAHPDFPMRMDGFELSTSEVLITCGQDNGQAALEIRFDREIPQDYRDHARNMAFIMIDHVLGEYDFAVKVGAVDFVEESIDPAAKWTPLSGLQPVFDRYWSETLGRTGAFPTGERQWSVMTVTFGESDEGEDGELADVATVTVNQSASAVAMRADLAYAFTLDLAVADRNELDAVRVLHDQAATLLELPQHGILAYTMVRDGRRKAVYYVGSEERAKQALAPLLLRIEDTSLEVTVSFDPTWSDYFEFASD